MPGLLIVGGCPRSGTTALTRLLNLHPEILVGDERYYWLFDRLQIAANHFEPERFFDLRREDRHWSEGREALPGDASPESWSDLAFVGDKYPPLWRVYDHLADTMPDAKLLIILRNPLSVAESYAARASDPDDRWPFDAERAIEDWNEAVNGAERALAGPNPVDVLVYEKLFGPHGDLAEPFRLLGLDPEPALGRAEPLRHRARRTFGQETPRDEQLRFEICRRADFAAYRRVLDRLDEASVVAAQEVADAAQH